MLRRLLVFPAVLALMVGALALPADAAPASCRTYTPPAGTIGGALTTATICVDVNGNNRRVYVTASSFQTPTTLTVNYAYLLQSTAPGGVQTVVVSNCCGWQGTSNNTASPVVYTGGNWLVQFGHVYQACAGVGVRDSTGGYDYGYICSLSFVN